MNGRMAKRCRVQAYRIWAALPAGIKNRRDTRRQVYQRVKRSYTRKEPFNLKGLL